MPFFLLSLILKGSLTRVRTVRAIGGNLSDTSMHSILKPPRETHPSAEIELVIVVATERIA
jgi:hypothetical protein